MLIAHHASQTYLATNVKMNTEKTKPEFFSFKKNRYT